MRLIFLSLACLHSAWVFASAEYALSPPSQAAQQQALADSAGRALIALAVETDLHSSRDGVWSQQGDERVWQLSIQAQEARSLGLQIEALGWPEQAQLVIRGAQDLRQQTVAVSDLVGARLWTVQFPGESIQLELRMPLAETGELSINTAYYGLQKVSAKHGNCNVDVVCPNNGDAANQIDSTVLLLFSAGNGLGVCSGFLVNNVRQDRAPYILTADHCQITASVQDSVRVYWQFEDDQCGNAPGHQEGDPNEFPSIGGVEVLAEGQDSDFTLLVLGSAQNPRAIPQSYEPYWSGWNVGNTPAQSGLGVHHPNGDEKSISRFSQPLQAVRADIDGRPTESWQVVWDSGTTQPGSSGSGLWNSSGQAVGVLSGGGASCSALDAPDFYGRLNVAWEEGSDCTQQLKHWLDPDDSGAVSLGGLASGAAGDPLIPVACDQPTATPQPTSAPSSSGSGGSLSPYLLLLLLVKWFGQKNVLNRRYTGSYERAH